MPDESLIGKCLGKFEIVEHLASGGMAEIYKAIDKSENRLVAIKVLPSGYARNDEMQRRFHREAQSARLLDHPNIVKIYEDGFDDGIHYFAMEYIEGQDLKEMLSVNSILSLPQISDILMQVCEALSYAHDRGIVHRDIKPSNIMIMPEGRIVVTDFGIAKSIDSTRITQTGTSMGTPEYMSPEQIQGTADLRSDIYSMGIVLYEMLTGVVPFSGDTPLAIAYKQVHQEPVPPKNIYPSADEKLSSICLNAIKKSPSDRFQTAKEIISILSDTEMPKNRESGISSNNGLIQAEKVKWRKDRIFIAIGFVISATLIAMALYLILGEQAKHIRLPTLFNLTRNQNPDIKGYLTLSSEPSKAKIEIMDNKGKIIKRAKTPIKSEELLPGKYKITGKKNGYYDSQIAVTIKEEKTVTKSMTLKPKEGKLHITSNPPGATIYLNDKVQSSKTPFTFSLNLGSYNIKLEMENYKTYSTNIKVKYDETKDLMVDLYPIN